LTRPRIFIIDAFAHIFRSYYAIRNIDNNAVYGFTNTLKRLMENESPDYLVVAFDSPGGSFRNELYPDYKANRGEMPEDMRPQIPYIKDIVKAYGVAMVEMSGYEADDIIGTLAVKAAEAGMQAVIVSGDKDLLQIVREDHIVMHDPSKGVEFMGAEAIPEFFGCKPDQIIDYLTIWGDSSDNVPGVPGVGQKGAAKLLEQYGSLDGIYEHLDEIKRKSYREGFEKARDQIELTRDLVTIRTDLDIPFDEDAYTIKDADTERLRELFQELGFKSLTASVPKKKARLKQDFQPADTEERLKSWIDKIREKGFFVFDLETSALNPYDAEIAGVALSVEAGDATYVPFRHPGIDEAWIEKATDMLKPLFADDQIVKCAHNAKFDISMLLVKGWDLAGTFEDTMLMSYLLNATDSRHSLDELADRVLDYLTIHFEDVAGSGKEQLTFDQVEVQAATNYAAEDAEVCLRLYEKLNPQLDEEKLRRAYEEVERPLVPVLARMETRGVRVDRDYLKSMSKQMAERIKELETKVYELAGEEFNIRSTKKLGEILFEKLELPPVKKTGKTKAYSTDQSVLEKLAAMGHELPEVLLEYRMITKLKSTYVDALPKMIHKQTERVHSSFNQFVTATGRLSSNNPNLQNIPIRTEMGREIRAAFLAQDSWKIVAADYSQIELRLMAHFSEDQTLTDGFQKGEDIHRRTASEIMDLDPEEVDDDIRRTAKSINFGLIYGMGEFRLAQELGITRREAKKYMQAYFEKMPRVLEFRDEVIERAKESGEIRTAYGHRRNLPEIQSQNNNLRAQGERLAVNTLIQGTAAEIIKLAMIKLDQALRDSKLRAHLLLQVHDELVLEAHADDAEKVEKLLIETMESVGDFNVPLTVEAHVSTNWKEAK
jgi:DNA polymerase-1